VILGLFEILVPLFFEVVILRAAKRGGVNVNTAEFGFERLI
jgi:hypothetical protein